MNLKHDASTGIRGVLWSQRGRWLTLRQAQLLSPNGTTAIDGDVLIPRENVAFLQLPRT